MRAVEIGLALHESTGGHSEGAIHHLERNDGITEAVGAFVAFGALLRFVIAFRRRQVSRLIQEFQS